MAIFNLEESKKNEFLNELRREDKEFVKKHPTANGNINKNISNNELDQHIVDGEVSINSGKNTIRNPENIGKRKSLDNRYKEAIKRGVNPDIVKKYHNKIKNDLTFRDNENRSTWNKTKNIKEACEYILSVLDETTILTGKRSDMLGYPLTNKRINGVYIAIYDGSNSDKALEYIDKDYDILKSNYSNIVEMLVEWFNKADDDYTPVKKSNFVLYEIDADDRHCYEFSFNMTGKSKSGKDYKDAGAFSIEVEVKNNKIEKKYCTII